MYYTFYFINDDVRFQAIKEDLTFLVLLHLPLVIVCSGDRDESLDLIKFEPGKRV